MHTLTQKISQSRALKSVATYVGCFLFFELCAHAKFFLPFTPVPITMHTFAVALIGTLFSFRVAMITFLCYLLEGFTGLFGTVINFGPSFGYFVGMMVSIFFLTKVGPKLKLPLLLNLVISSLIIWSFGVLHLQSFFGWKKAVLLGVCPFVAGDALKLSISYSLLKVTKKFQTQ